MKITDLFLILPIAACGMIIWFFFFCDLELWEVLKLRNEIEKKKRDEEEKRNLSK